MGFKTKWNRFWTLRNTEGGFTLVELIVVIAILAILAGVAVPAYTGYIKRAREAGDQLLIAAVNEAFVSSCLEAGVEMIEVTDAKVSVSEQMVFGVSSVAGASDAELNVICSTFNQLFEGNFNTPFVTENVKSLYWVPAEASFKMDHVNSVASRVILSNGKTVNISPEDMEAIQNSTFDNMGYTEVAAVIENLSGSSTTLAEVAGGLGMMNKLTDVMLANGLISQAKAKEMQDNLALKNIGKESYKDASNEAANGIQMVTAKYLASGKANIDELLSYNLTNSTDMLESIADGNSGTKTVSAAALQYAMVQSFANTDDIKDATITMTVPKYTKILGVNVQTGTKTYTGTVSDYLASEEAQIDPIASMNAVKNTTEYQNYADPTEGSQYSKDLAGFVGTMSLLGDNMGSVDKNGNITTDGAVNPGDYLSEGIKGQDASDILSAVLGK